MKVQYWCGGRKSKPCFEALSLKELNMLKSVFCTPGCNMLGSNLATYHDSIFNVDFHGFPLFNEMLREEIYSPGSVEKM